MMAGKTEQHEDIKSSFSKLAERDNQEEPQDYEVHTKKDAPPRFSTIFETKPHPTYIEPCDEAPRRRRRSGIFIPMPIFVLIIIIFLFESTIIFAYTTIGLYNQLPRSMTYHGTSATCDMSTFTPAPAQALAAAPQQAPINIAPNFVVGGGDQPTVTETITLTEHASTTSQASTSANSTSSLSTSSAITSSTTSTYAVVTVTPGGPVVTSYIMITQTPSQVTAERPTVTVFKGPDSTSASNTISSSSADSAKDANVSTHASDSTTSTSTASTISSTTTTTASTSTTPPPAPSTTSSSTASSEAARGTRQACVGGVGGAGAALLNCG